MPSLISLYVAGNLGTNAGAGSDGVLVGQIPATDPTKALLKTMADYPLCFADDGGTYTNYDTEIAEATGDDVDALPATPADDDALYIGYAASTFTQIKINLTTAGDWTGNLVWQYWDGDAWQALADVVDGTTNFKAVAGWKDVDYTLPVDWAECTVDSVEAYWVRAIVDNYAAVVTQPLIGQAAVVLSTPLWTDDTTDFTDAGAGDVALLPAYPVEGDGFYVGYGAKFCKLKVTTSQARTGTATLTLKYWDGDSWEAVTTVDDDSVGWLTTAGTLLVNFVPPTDWVACTAANGPNGEAGYFVAMELTAMTDVTQQPLATQGWVIPLDVGAGVVNPVAANVYKVCMDAGTASAGNGDTTLLIANLTQGTCTSATWTKQDAYIAATTSLDVAANDNLAVIQVTEDGSTEFADANILLSMWY